MKKTYEKIRDLRKKKIKVALLSEPQGIGTWLPHHDEYVDANRLISEGVEVLHNAASREVLPYDEMSMDQQIAAAKKWLSKIETQAYRSIVELYQLINDTREDATRVKFVKIEASTIKDGTKRR